MKKLLYYRTVYMSGLENHPYKDEIKKHLWVSAHSDRYGTAKERIDEIKKYPERRVISIGGLKQDTFDYFLETYGNQFEAISFWKCPLVKDFTKIETLKNIKYISYFRNQKVESLWDFTKTPSLIGFNFQGFTKMHKLNDISKSETLEELDFGETNPGQKYIVESLSPLSECQTLKYLTFRATKVEDNKIEPLASLRNLKQIDFFPSLFSTEQVAWLKAKLPDDIESKVLGPIFKVHESRSKFDDKDTIIVGKGQPCLSSSRHADKIEKYKEEFDVMYNWFKMNYDAKPEDYSKK